LRLFSHPEIQRLLRILLVLVLALAIVKGMIIVKVREIIELTKERPLNKIAKDHLSIGEKAARKALQAAGAFHQSGKKGWQFSGDESVLDQSIYDFAGKNESTSTHASIVISTHKSDNDINELFGKPKLKKQQRIYRGYYFDPDVLRVIDQAHNKTELINRALRSVFESEGLL
jgi:hypothetical protein